MDKFTRVTGVAALMPMANIDTGAMAPSGVTRDNPNNLGKVLFANWRYIDGINGQANPDFVLNQPRGRDAQIIVAGPNFGCGSSRETAVWALMQYGVRCVIGSSFGEIFRDNAFQNGLLPVILPIADVQAIMDKVTGADEPLLTVDLEDCKIILPDGSAIGFEIAPERRTALLEGLDETQFLMRHDPEIAAFQQRDRVARPWIHTRPPRIVQPAA